MALDKSIHIIMIMLLNLSVSCSYVSDYIEGKINNRASFSIEAVYVNPNVVITWDEDQGGSEFAGFEVYRTASPNDEYASYELVASRWTFGALGSGGCSSYSFNATGLHGKYYFRVGVIAWDESDVKDRTSENGYIHGEYSELDPDGWDTEGNYNDNTDIDSVSGYVEVLIP